MTKDLGDNDKSFTIPSKIVKFVENVIGVPIKGSHVANAYLTKANDVDALISKLEENNLDSYQNSEGRSR